MVIRIRPMEMVSKMGTKGRRMGLNKITIRRQLII